MTQFCERCGAPITEEPKTTTEGDIVCEICWEEESHANTIDEHIILEPTDDLSDDVPDDDFDNDSGYNDDEFEYDPFSDSYTDEEDLYGAQ